jgi:hypothetical protein
MDAHPDADAEPFDLARVESSQAFTLEELNGHIRTATDQTPTDPRTPPPVVSWPAPRPSWLSATAFLADIDTYAAPTYRLSLTSQLLQEYPPSVFAFEPFLSAPCMQHMFFNWRGMAALSAVTFCMVVAFFLQPRAWLPLAAMACLTLALVPLFCSWFERFALRQLMVRFR